MSSGLKSEMTSSYWLCKTEPETYSFDQLVQDKATHWNDVRNYQARNYIRKMKPGEKILIYHSGADKSVIGIAEVTRPAYPDHDIDGGDWSQFDLKPIAKLKKPVPLATLKETRELESLPLLKQSRLSVMPISEQEFNHILKLGSSK